MRLQFLSVSEKVALNVFHLPLHLLVTPPYAVRVSFIYAVQTTLPILLIFSPANDMLKHAFHHLAATIPSKFPPLSIVAPAVEF